MPIPESVNLAEQIDITATVDDNEVLTVSKVLYKATVNEPRSVTIQVSDKESLMKCRLGAVLKIEVGRGGGVHNLNFEGIIKVVKPSNQTHTIVALDRITFLATSEFRDFKDSDIVGQDLYYLIKDAADYRDINVRETTLGSSIKATKAMGLSGLQKRKDFIDKCIDFMVASFNDDFHENTDFVRYNYAIRSGNKFDIYLADFKNNSNQAVIKISEDYQT